MVLFLRSLLLGFGFGILWLPGYALPLWVSLRDCGCSDQGPGTSAFKSLTWTRLRLQKMTQLWIRKGDQLSPFL